MRWTTPRSTFSWATPLTAGGAALPGVSWATAEEALEAAAPRRAAAANTARMRVIIAGSWLRWRMQEPPVGHRYGDVAPARWLELSTSCPRARLRSKAHANSGGPSATARSL